MKPYWRDEQRELDRLAEPLGASETWIRPAKARQCVLLPCGVEHARLLIRKWHSRLPRTQRGPWQYAFCMAFDDVTYAVALLHNPSARTLPAHWIELRRLAVAPDSPHCMASRMLGELRKWFRANAPEREMMISYQDSEVHTGTIYRAAGWTVGRVQRPRQRDRSALRPSGRAYRTSLNEEAPDVAGKVRWQTRVGPSQKATDEMAAARLSGDVTYGDQPNLFTEATA